jgi:hypothetical protein
LVETLVERVVVGKPGDVLGNSLRIPRDGDQRSELMSITIPK